MSHYVFAWKRGTSPQFVGPFADEYAANRHFHRLKRADPELFAWVLQPVPAPVEESLP